MADIKQAAKWMEQGHRVRRPGWYEDIFMRSDSGGVVRCFAERNVRVLPVLTDHLLADDWEIAE